MTTASLTLFSSSLLSRYGFNDGDLPDELDEWLDAQDPPIEDWAYDHLDPSASCEDVGGYVLWYSADPSHYTPMCRGCHVLLDKRYARESRSQCRSMS